MAFDVDLDIADGNIREQFGIRAIMYDEDKQAIQPHPSGIYMEPTIPVDQETGWAAVPYKEAEEKGWMKIDLLTNSAYAVFQNTGCTKEDVLRCYHQEPDWDALVSEFYIKRLPHIHKHGDFIRELDPRSIHDLADALALIRPGKKHLIKEYLNGDQAKVRRNLYKRPANGKMFFKKSHSYAYAAMIICAFNALYNNYQLVEF